MTSDTKRTHMKQCQVLIIAAGSNSRFFPLNQRTHKGGISLGGQPLLAQTLTNLHEHGFDEVILVVSSKDLHGQGLSGHIPTDFLGMNLTFAEQVEAKGMGDAILGIQEMITGRFAVISPYHTQAGRILTQMVDRPEPCVVAVTETSSPWNYGIVSLQEDKAVALIEKPPQGTEPSNLKLSSLYVLSPEYLTVLASVPAEEYNFENALNQVMGQSDVGVVRLDQSPPSLKYPWQLFDFQSQLFASMRSYRSPDALIDQSAVIDETHGPVFIEAGVRIGHAAKIVGPCYLGKKALVGDFSFIRGSSVEAEAQIGANTEVVRSILLEKASLHFGYLADSIVGTEAKIGAGLITANKRLDRQHIVVEVKGKKVDVGRNNLGVIVGDGANVGIRVSTMPGVLIGAGAIIFPGSILYNHIDHHQTYKPNAS